MSEEVVEAVQADIPVEEVSSLPSDVEAQAEAEAKKNELPDGWNSVEEMAAYIKEMKDKYANLNREISDEKKATEADIEATKAEVEKQQLQQTTIQELLPQFLENGMVLTDEMKDKLVGTGLTEEQVKLGAYEYKEARQRNASYVGGEENFVQIMEYTKQAFSEQEHISLQATVEELNTKGLSTQPLMLGLQKMYEDSIGVEKPQDRVRGNIAAGGIKGYETKQELFRDKAYIDSVAGRRDAGAQKRYRDRLAATPEEVWR